MKSRELLSSENLPYLVVIAGGSGTRFWPKSTSQKPKQLLNFFCASENFSARHAAGTSDTKGTILGQTLSRFDPWIPKHQKLIVTTSFLKGAIEKEGLEATLLAEPQGRNTAPCIYWAAQWIAQKNPKAVMMVMPSDHAIVKPQAFLKTVQDAVQWAMMHDDLVTLGIKPSRPETGYGYLKTVSYAHPVRGGFSLDLKKVESFVEKPNLEKASEFLKNGNYLWNGGMFIWRVDVILAAFDRWMPEMKEAWTQAQGQIEIAYPKMTATSIDYGIMEKASNVVTLPLDCGWDDLGSWTSLDALADFLKIRLDANVVMGGEVLAMSSKNNIVDVPKRLVALLGVEDLIIAEQGDALLVAHKKHAQEIKRLVEEVRKRRPDLV